MKQEWKQWAEINRRPGSLPVPRRFRVRFDITSHVRSDSTTAPTTAPTAKIGDNLTRSYESQWRGLLVSVQVSDTEQDVW